MQLSIEPNEVDLLHRILTQYVSELKPEISNTENFTWRQEMKRDEEAVKRIITDLDKSKSVMNGARQTGGPTSGIGGRSAGTGDGDETVIVIVEETFIE